VIPLAIGLACAGALCFALAARKQHSAVGQQADGSGSGLDTGQLLELVRNRAWLIGFGLATCGALLHVAALTFAPLIIAQPIGVLALPISVVLTARDNGWRLPLPALAGTLASVAGIAGFVGLAASRAVSGPIPDAAELKAGLAAAGLCGALVLVAITTKSWIRCLAFATAAGVAFGLVSTLLRAITQRMAETDSHWYDDPTVVGSVVGIGLGLFAGGVLVQQAFTSGPPELVIGALTVMDPLVGVALGALFLGETVRATPAAMVGGLVCAGLAMAGIFMLARYHPEVAERAPTHDGRAS
jgi:hypothetical protein